MTNLLLKKLIYLLGTLLIFSCKKNEDSKISENQNPTINYNIVTKHFPDKYDEEIIDTILDRGTEFRVQIKKMPLVDKFVVQQYEIDNKQTQKNIYHDNIISIKVSAQDTVLLDTLLKKDKLVQIEDKDFLDKAILYNAWIKEFNKSKQEVLLIFTVNVPDTDWAYDFSISVSKKSKKIILLEEIE